MAFAAPLAAEAAPAIAGAAEGSAAAGAASEGAASSAGSAAAGKAATKTKAPSPKKPSGASKAADKGVETVGFGEASKDLLGSKKGSSKPAKGPSGKKFLSKVGNKKILLPEMISCLVVLVFGTLVAPKGSKDDVHRLLVKGSALMGVFFILAIISTGGKGPQKFANILGLLITLSYLLNSSDIHNIVNWVNGFFSKPKDGKSKTPPSESDTAPPMDTTEPATLPGPPTMEV